MKPIIGLGGFVVIAAGAQLLIGAGGGTAPDLTWHTVDCGGGINSFGAGGLTLSGTAGQPESGRMLGAGGLELHGGFWFPIPPSDCEYDGDVDLNDFNEFLYCVEEAAGGPPTAECRCFDVNRDSALDMLDWSAFQRSFTG